MSPDTSSTEPNKQPPPSATERPEFSRLALGCWGFADPGIWGSTEERQALATIHAAVDHGITVLDTAPGYGDGLSEEIVGRALAGRRDAAFVATKVGADSFSADGARESLDESLRRLRTDYVDLLQIHWVGDEERFGEVVATFEALRDAGKTRACGVCNFGPGHLERLRKIGRGWVSNQLPYNLIWRAIEIEIVDPCIRDGLGILAYSPLQQGLLAGKYQTADAVPVGRARTRHFSGSRAMARHGEEGFETETFATVAAIRAVAERIDKPMSHVAIGWLLAQRGVSSVIIGATRPEQVADNAAAMSSPLDAETLAELTRVTDDLKVALGPNPDMWAAVSRYR